MGSRVLIVEDNQTIREATKDYFISKSDGEMKVISVGSGSKAMKIIKEEKFDLVLLDVMLPDIDGFSLCRVLRQESIVPVIFLTARSREEDILFGYDIGCDDYVTKPFSLAELYAKSRAILKRSGGNVISSEIICGEIRLDTASHQVSVSGKNTELALKEFEILRFLIQNKNHVIDRNTILDVIWGRDYFGCDRVVDNHIRKLRKALGTSGRQIMTVIGKGYKITE